MFKKINNLLIIIQFSVDRKLMIIVNHRVNSLSQLKSNPLNYGCEIDIRNHNKKLYLVHDPYNKNAIVLDQWLKSYKNKFLILNVKEEGLEEELIILMKKFKIKNYFILDETIPYIFKYANLGISKFALRISEIEHYKSVEIFQKKLMANKKKINWIWIDTFTGNPINKNLFLKLKKLGLKTCFVSPELHHQHNKEVWKDLINNFSKKLISNKIKPDMVCTKLPELWNNIDKRLR